MVNNPGSSGIALTVWFQGCSVHCPGCHNPELWDHGGTEMNVMDIAEIMHGRVQYTDLVLLGGEPLEQPHDQLIHLMRMVHDVYHVRVWLYTSYELGDIPSEILNHTHVVKTGRYDRSLPGDGLLSSTNQILWDRVKPIRHIGFMRGENDKHEHRIIFTPRVRNTV